MIHKWLYTAGAIFSDDTRCAGYSALVLANCKICSPHRLLPSNPTILPTSFRDDR